MTTILLYRNFNVHGLIMANFIILCIFKSSIFSQQSAIWRPGYLYFSWFWIMWLSNRPISSDRLLKSSKISFGIYSQASAKSSQTWVSVFSISESEILLTKWASYRRLRYPSPIFEQTDLEDFLCRLPTVDWRLWTADY